MATVREALDDFEATMGQGSFSPQIMRVARTSFLTGAAAALSLSQRPIMESSSKEEAAISLAHLLLEAKAVLLLEAKAVLLLEAKAVLDETTAPARARMAARAAADEPKRPA